MRERTPLPGSLIRRLPKLRMLGMTGARNASLDVEACTERGVVVCKTGSYVPNNEAATAELALGLLLSAARAIPQGDANIRAGRFQQDVPIGISLAGKTMGVIGLGKLGGFMARYCLALQMNVIAWSQNLTEERAAEVGVKRVEKDELLSTSDAMSIHLVLSPRSRGLIGAAEIARMKKGAILVNTSRGPIVDEAALVQAVQQGRIVAALDVFDREPLPPDHPLRKAPNTVLTPHLGTACGKRGSCSIPTAWRTRSRSSTASRCGRRIRRCWGRGRERVSQSSHFCVFESDGSWDETTLS